MGNVRWPRGLRWECRGCANCCSGGFDLGPVEPEVIATLQAQRIEERWAPAAEAPWAQLRRSPTGQEAWFLRQRGGRCIFLREDDRCAVHAELGPSFKPGFCREFPYHFVHDPRGVVAVVRPDCGGFHQSAQDGPLVTEEEVTAALSLPRVVPRRTFAPDAVRVLDRSIALEPWLVLEDRLVQELEALEDQPLAALVVTLRRQLAEGAGVALPEPSADRAQAALQAVFGVLEAVLRQVSAQPGPPDRVAFVTHMVERLGVARAGATAPLPALEPELDRYLGLLLRSAVMARTWQPHGAVEAGLGAWLLGMLFGIAAGGPTLRAFDPAYRDWTKLSGNSVIGMVLGRSTGALVELSLHLS
jgi:Fe-S-cluster containining protein